MDGRRYDVRAALTDISQYEAPAGGYDNRLDYLSSEEQRAEQLCEHERYFSLHNNDVEEELYKGKLNFMRATDICIRLFIHSINIVFVCFSHFAEEELKRLKNTIGSAGYAQVSFNYEQPATSASNASAEQAIDSGGDDSKDVDNGDNNEVDEVYVPHPKFVIPSGMDLPETTKVHAIIEKTAKFIAGQGAQMEILIKAKQANNPLFEFLNQNSRLNRFYKHMLQTMKDGKYPEVSDRVTDAPTENNETQMQGTSMPDYYSSTANYSKVSVAMPRPTHGQPQPFDKMIEWFFFFRLHRFMCRL